MAEALLTLEGVRAGYGDSIVLDDVSFDIAEGESLAVLGRNGVGKTTLMLTIMGFTRLAGGRVAWRGRDVTRLAPHLRARLGLGWVAQERDIFPSLSVEENLTVTASRGRWDLAAAYRLFPRLAERRQAMGNHLSGGEQQMLTVVRTLMGNPRVILVDEPTEGLAPLIVKDVLDMLATVRKSGVTVLMVEQNFKAAIKVADRFYIMSKGQIVFSGNQAELLAAEDVRKNYLEV